VVVIFILCFLHIISLRIIYSNNSDYITMSSKPSASDVMKAKRFVELRKKKLKQTLVIAPVVEEKPQPSPFKSLSLPFVRNSKKTTTYSDGGESVPDRMIIIESSSTMSSLGGGPAAPDLPSTQIRNHFARASMSYEDSLTENGSSSSRSGDTSTFSRPETGRNRLQRAISERRVKASTVCGHDDDDNDENKNSGPFPASKKDLRSIYQQYLDGNVEKECVVRTGKQWTQGYRSRRFQEIQ